MLKLIVGLGNPGQKYQNNRHNAGFLFVDYLLENTATKWLKEPKFYGLVASTSQGANKIMLLKPQTFMNKSGLAVAALARFYKIKAAEILIIHDELDFAIGTVKLKIGGGHAGHNGLRDITASLGDNGFCRARLGIGRPPVGKPVIDYVLTDFAKAQKTQLFAAFSILAAQMDHIKDGNMEIAMREIN